MNLMGIVQGAISTVTPYVSATLSYSDGFTVNADYSRTPTYTTPIVVPAQVQALTYKDLLQVDAVNLAGEARRVYFYGDVQSVVRAMQKGGDLFTLTDGPNVGTWLVVHVLETWPDWCACACVLQSS